MSVEHLRLFLFANSRGHYHQQMVQDGIALQVSIFYLIAGVLFWLAVQPWHLKVPTWKAAGRFFLVAVFWPLIALLMLVDVIMDPYR